MFACHHSLALPREFQSYRTLLLCSEHFQELVLCVTPVVVISLPYQQTKNNQATMNFQLHVACVFSALPFVRNKLARTELFLAQNFNLLNALHADNGSILPTLFALFALSLTKYYCNMVISNTASYPRGLVFETRTRDRLSKLNVYVLFLITSSVVQR